MPCRMMLAVCMEFWNVPFIYFLEVFVRNIGEEISWYAIKVNVNLNANMSVNVHLMLPPWWEMFLLV